MSDNSKKVNEKSKWSTKSQTFKKIQKIRQSRSSGSRRQICRIPSRDPFQICRIPSGDLPIEICRIPTGDPVEIYRSRSAGSRREIPTGSTYRSRSAGSRREIPSRSRCQNKMTKKHLLIIFKIDQNDMSEIH
jgi:hypothetical protein